MAYYLEEHLRFPFQAKYIAWRAISFLRKGLEVEVLGFAPAEECEGAMSITVTWEHRTLAVPLAQLEAIQADKATQQAVEKSRRNPSTLRPKETIFMVGHY
jgi:hypothetical protein